MSRREKGKGTWRSEGQWRSLLAKYGDSGLGVEEFCRSQAISASSFYRWRSALQAVPDGGQRRRSEEVAGFVDLGRLDPAPPRRASLELKLDLGDGLMLHLVRN